MENEEGEGTAGAIPDATASTAEGAEPTQPEGGQQEEASAKVQDEGGTESDLSSNEQDELASMLFGEKPPWMRALDDFQGKNPSKAEFEAALEALPDDQKLVVMRAFQLQNKGMNSSMKAAADARKEYLAKKKEAEATLSKATEQEIRFIEQMSDFDLQEILKSPEEDPEPDRMQDMEAWLEWQVRKGVRTHLQSYQDAMKSAAEKQQMKQAEAAEQARIKMRQAELTAFEQEHPDFDRAEIAAWYDSTFGKDTDERASAPVRIPAEQVYWMLKGQKLAHSQTASEQLIASARKASQTSNLRSGPGGIVPKMPQGLSTIEKMEWLEANPSAQDALYNQIAG